MNNLPFYISFAFVLTSILAVFLFYRAANQSKIVLLVIVAWSVVQAILAIPGFYTVTNTIPPRFVLAIGPPMFFILVLFLSRWGRTFLDSLNNRLLTLVHVIRIPVEIVLFLLFLHKAIPGIMTFEGSNFDIAAGISAPLVFYFLYAKGKYSRNILLMWNFICIGLLINIVTIAILAAPFPFQKLAFGQPNIAIFYFPFVWLPATIVPLVFLSHLASIRQLLREKKNRSFSPAWRSDSGAVIG